ncbi:MMPL family transporter [Corynebacterium anserum]
MAKLLFHIARWCYIHHKRVVAGWLIALCAIAGVALSIQKGFSESFAMREVPSSHATKLMLEKFPGTKHPIDTAGVNVVFEAPEGQRLDQPEYMAAMDQTVEAIKNNVKDLGNTERLMNPIALNDNLHKKIITQLTSKGIPESTAKEDADNLRMVSQDGRYGTMYFEYDVPIPADVTKEDRQAVVDALQISRDAGLKAEAGGPGFGEPVAVEPFSEVAGIVVGLLILLWVFRSWVASFFPLVTAVVGVSIGTLLTLGGTAFAQLNTITPTLGMMIGLAVGIDYALFIMSRFRDELKEGRSREDAIGLATGTAGSAVVFAGLTVIIALVALRLAGIPFLAYMGYAAAATVGVSVLVAISFLPAMLGWARNKVFKREVEWGHRIQDARAHQRQIRGGIDGNRDSVRFWKSNSQHGPKESLGTKWVKLIHKAPGLAIIVVFLLLGALTLPAMKLELALPSDKTGNVDTTQRKAAEMLEEGFGAGRNSPFLAVVNADNVNENSPALEMFVRSQADVPRHEAAMRASFLYTVQQMSANIEVKHAQLLAMSPDGTTAQIVITPIGGPTEKRTVDLIKGLREQQREIQAETGVDMGITGFTAIQQDVTDQLSEAMPIYLGLVVGLALLLLMMVFRSLMVPLIAATGFLLSVGAAFGVTVLVWQEGLWNIWPSPGPLISFMPIFLIGVTFGLAMDYQVFIVSRMRERFASQKRKIKKMNDPNQEPFMAPNSSYTLTEDSVIGGFGMGASVVTAAALIMIGVFISFVFQPLPFIRIFGFALGAGVLFDAFLIRMTLVPALMMIAGRSTWYMPRWLDKVLPTVDVEGEALEKAYEAGEIGDVAKHREGSQVSEMHDETAVRGKRRRRRKKRGLLKSRRRARQRSSEEVREDVADTNDATSAGTTARLASAAGAGAGGSTLTSGNPYEQRVFDTWSDADDDRGYRHVGHDDFADDGDRGHRHVEHADFAGVDNRGYRPAEHNDFEDSGHGEIQRDSDSAYGFEHRHGSEFDGEHANSRTTADYDDDYVPRHAKAEDYDDSDFEGEAAFDFYSGQTQTFEIPRRDNHRQ